MANISLTHGRCSLSSLAYCYYAFVVGPLRGEYKIGYEFGKVGMELTKRYNNDSATCKSGFIYSIGPALWRSHLSEAFPILQNAFGIFLYLSFLLSNKTTDVAVDSGNIPYACYTSHYIVTDAFYGGQSLQVVSTYYDKYLTFLKKNNWLITYFGLCVTIPFRWLVGMNDFNEQECLTTFKGVALIEGAYPKIVRKTSDRNYDIG